MSLPLPEPIYPGGRSASLWLRLNGPAQAAAVLPPLAAGVIAFLVYLVTLAPDLTWENFGADGAELITAAVTWGVPHPPGYPLYVVLGHVISQLPVGPVAWRFHLLSALAMAIAVGFTAAAARSLLTDPGALRPVSGPGKGIPRRRATALAAASAGLTLAFMPLVWSQALIAEVYALNLAVVAALLWALLSRRSGWLIGLLLGLSLTTHLTSLLLVPLVLWRTPRRAWPALIAGLLLGVSPYLLLLILAHSGSPVRWGDPDTLTGWWWLVSGRLYAGNVLGLPAAAWGPRAGQWAGPLLRQLAGAGWLILLVSWRQGATGAGSTKLALSLTALAYGLYALGYSSADAIVFLLPGLLLLSAQLASGLRRFGPIGYMLPLVLLALNFKRQDLRTAAATGPTGPIRAQVHEALSGMPSAALVLTPGDQSLATLWYFQHVEGWRPDLVLVDSNLLAFDWYRAHLAARHPELVALDRDDVPRFAVENSRTRPVCYLSLAMPAGNQCP